MKPLLKTFAVIIALNIGVWSLPQSASAQVVTFQVFYDNLSPYGQWVTYPNYGYVWVPNVGADFTPYGTNGHWVLTDDGWTWVSDYAWGWAPFHYGRWNYDQNYGWLWVPDETWGPAWVSWRTGGGCYGWTPLGFGVGVGVAFYAPPERWLFCDQAHFGDPYISRYYLPRGNYATIYARTSVINTTHAENGRTFYAGPDRTEVQRVTHKTFAPVPIRSSSKPGSSVSGNTLNIYRPAVKKATTGGARPAPSKVANIKDVKPAGRIAAQPAKTATPPAKQSTSNTQHSTGALPNTLHPSQHTTTNVPISHPQNQAAKTSSSYPAPYSVHPSTTKNTPRPAPQPQRSAPAPQQQQRSAPTQQHSAPPVQHSAPQRTAPAPQQQRAPQPQHINNGGSRQQAPPQEQKRKPG